jgi:peptidoglycan/xylan/chitin deacetylase (PgdA/CDA1 family)
MAQGLKNIAAAAAAAAGLDRAARRGDRAGGRGLYVLAYHRVDEPDARPDLDPLLITATPRQFDAQMRALARDLHPVTVDEVLRALRDDAPLPRDAVLVTVDDGYRDFAEHAAPAALRHGVRPLLFMPTAFVGGGLLWWDQLHRIATQAGGDAVETPFGVFPVRTPGQRRELVERWRRRAKETPDGRREIEERYAALQPAPGAGDALLGWDDLRRLVAAGVSVASHTHTHPLVGQLSAAQVRDEVRTSRALLERELGAVPPVFAYPDGRAPRACGGEAEQVLREEGLQLAFTMREGRADLAGDPPLRLPRISVAAGEGTGLFRLHLTPQYDRWKRAR